jgi:hypothetical protein
LSIVVSKVESVKGQKAGQPEAGLHITDSRSLHCSWERTNASNKPVRDEVKAIDADLALQ